MITLVPAILSRDPDEVREKIRFLESIPELTDVHIDFADNRFVPNQTVSPRDLAGLKTRLRIEAHMMVMEPQQYFHDLEAMQARFLYLHYESFSRIADLLTAVGNAKFMDFQCGVALNPGTDISVVERLLPKIDGVLLMSVQPGFQGQPFVPDSMDRLELLRRAHKDLLLELDGGVNQQNFGVIASYGADRAVAGSAIWQTLDAKKTIHEFLKKQK